MALTRKLLGATNYPDGTVATQANTSSSQPVVANGGSSITYASSKAPASGQTGLRIANVAGQTTNVRYLFDGGSTYASASYTMRFWSPESAPSSTITLWGIRHAGPGRAYNLQWTAAGVLSLYDSVNTITDIAAAGVLSLNTQYVVSQVVTGASTTAGDVFIRIYAVGSSTPIVSKHITNANLSASNLAGIDLSAATNAAAAAIGFSNLQYDTASTTEIPDYIAANTNPIIEAGNDQSVAAGATVNLTANASDADGDSLTYSWAFVYSSTTTPALTGSTTSTPSFTATATEGNLYILQCTVTDGKGGSSQDTVEVRVPTSGNFTTLPVDGSNPSWTLVGTASTSGRALSDTDDTTLVRSPSYTATESETRIRLQPLRSRSSLQINVRSLVSAVGGVTKVRLYAGTTLKQEWEITQSTTAADQVLNVSTNNLPSTGEWGTLYIAPVVASA
jgi:hypothetical protein